MHTPTLITMPVHFLSPPSPMCYVTDVNKTFHAVDINCNFWVTFWFKRQWQQRQQVWL